MDEGRWGQRHNLREENYDKVPYDEEKGPGDQSDLRAGGRYHRAGDLDYGPLQRGATYEVTIYGVIEIRGTV